MAMDDGEERRFYEIEALKQNWSLRELKRQFNSGLENRQTHPSVLTMLLPVSILVV
jgi:predicted nuclease of restriction endonuclease-like (RecB) superfamily